jgi:hypothetical protein
LFDRRSPTTAAPIRAVFSIITVGIATTGEGHMLLGSARELAPSLRFVACLPTAMVTA